MALRLLALVFGLFLLLPGVCSFGFMLSVIPAIIAQPNTAGDLVPLGLLWLVCFAVSYGGYRVIRMAARELKAASPAPPQA